MDARELETYLHVHIPLSAAMHVTARDAQADFVVLEAPLLPNINHRETVFGGSASALAILAAWSLMRVRLDHIEPAPRIVIRRNSVEYDAPMLTSFSATATFAEPDAWPRFLQILGRRGKSRAVVRCSLESGGEQVGSFEGEFVAVAAP